jgi:predicted enzyme related to lactoylglutathione lyase
MSEAGGWIWYELLTADVPAAMAFYGKVIGWKPVAHSPVEGYQMFASPVCEVGGMMTLPAEAGLARPVWVGYIHVADVDATFDAIRKDGATPCMPPSDIPDVGRFAMILDPQRVPVYVMKPAPVGGESRAFAPLVGHCQWNELVTTDPAAALAFYTWHFNWQKGDTMPMGPMGDYQFLLQGGTQMGAIMKRDREGAPPIWRFYFGVADIDAAVQLATQAGGQQLHDIMPVPGGGFAVAMLDPQGAEFGLAGPRKT